MSSLNHERIKDETMTLELVWHVELPMVLRLDEPAHANLLAQTEEVPRYGFQSVGGNLDRHLASLVNEGHIDDGAKCQEGAEALGKLKDIGLLPLEEQTDQAASTQKFGARRFDVGRVDFASTRFVEYQIQLKRFGPRECRKRPPGTTDELLQAFASEPGGGRFCKDTFAFCPERSSL